MQLRTFIPLRLRRLRHHPFGLRGSTHQCPCCGGRFRRLAPQNRRPNARCPRCGALERHRTLCLYLEDVLDGNNEPLRVLHFAPERSISDLLASRPWIDSVRADLDPEAAEQQIDITDIPYADGSFDLILVSHVLEHVPDDGAALSELYRVVRPGGRVLMQHPIDHQLTETYEDFTIEASDERRKHFGQEDHVRIYGRDFPLRVERAGFEVEVVQPGLELEPRLRLRYAILDPEDGFRSDDIYVCTKSVSRPV